VDILSVEGFNVLPGKTQEFQDWVRANSDALAEHSPDGTELVGIYATVISSEKHSGNTKIIWRLDSFGAMDRFRAAMEGDPELARLLDELGAFGDVRIGADYSEELLKSFAEIAFWGDHPEED
jgi:hypothetical protein